MYLLVGEASPSWLARWLLVEQMMDRLALTNRGGILLCVRLSSAPPTNSKRQQAFKTHAYDSVFCSLALEMQVMIKEEEEEEREMQML